MLSEKTRNGLSPTARIEAPESNTSSISFWHVTYLGFSLAYFAYWSQKQLKSPVGLVHTERRLIGEVNAYKNGKFFIPEEPPLVAQIVTGLSYLLRPKTDEFGFYLRSISGVCSAVLFLVVHMICVSIGFGKCAVLGTILMLFENAYLTGLQYNLKLSFSLLFTFLAVLCCIIYRRARPFSLHSVAVLLCFGLCSAVTVTSDLHCSLTCVWLVTNVLYDSWCLWEDRSWTTLNVLTRIGLEFVALVVTPIMCYLLCFSMHFGLKATAPDAGLMSSAFQATLKGGLSSYTAEQPKFIQFGSQITIRNSGKTPPCWLHSHKDKYPLRYNDGRGSSHQQQVTCYEYKDVNNWWLVSPADGEQSKHLGEIVSNGDSVQLLHGMTQRLLNSHDVAAPMTPQAQEVSCYIDYNISMPAEPNWTVIFTAPVSNSSPWRSIDTEFELFHMDEDKRLRLSGKRLDDFGFEQLEIVVDEEKLGWNRWNVEEHKIRFKGSEQQPDVQTSEMSFIQKVTELHEKMWSGIARDESIDLEREFYSCEPMEWLMGDTSVGFHIDGKDHLFVKPNQFIIYGLLITWCIFTITLLLIAIACRRGVMNLNSDIEHNLKETVRFIGAGLVINLVPHCMSVRVLHYEHYIAAFIFGVMLAGACLHILLNVVFEKFTIIRTVIVLGCVAWLAAVVVPHRVLLNMMG